MEHKNTHKENELNPTRARVHDIISKPRPAFRSTPEYVQLNLERMRKQYEESLERAESLGIIKNGVLTCADGKRRFFEKWDKIAERILADENLQKLIAGLDADESCLPFITADLSQAPLNLVINAIKKRGNSGLQEEITGTKLTTFDKNCLNAKPAGGKLGVVFIDNGNEVPKETLGMSSYQFAEFCRSNGYHMTDAQNRAMMTGIRERETIGMLCNSNDNFMAYSQSSPTTDLRFGLLDRKNPGDSSIGGRREVKVS